MKSSTLSGVKFARIHFVGLGLRAFAVDSMHTGMCNCKDLPHHPQQHASVCYLGFRVHSSQTRCYVLLFCTFSNCIEERCKEI